MREEEEEEVEERGEGGIKRADVRMWENNQVCARSLFDCWSCQMTQPLRCCCLSFFYNSLQDAAVD